MKEIEITTGMNGYPAHLHKGFIEFDSMAEAEKFAQENHGEVVELRKRDGWHFWESRGHAFGPFHIGAETYGDDYRTVTAFDNWEDECRELLSAMISDEASLEDLSKAIEEMRAIGEKVENLDAQEAVLLYQGKFQEIIKLVTMDYREDVWSYQIGVETLQYGAEN